MVPKARGLLIEDWNRFCAKSNGTEDCPFEARHTENAIRIALVLHTFRHVDIEQEAQARSTRKCRRTITLSMNGACATRSEFATGSICTRTHCGRRSAPLLRMMRGTKHRR